MDAQWYHILTNVGEILVGMLIGTELIIEELKKSGKQIVTIWYIILSYYCKYS